MKLHTLEKLLDQLTDILSGSGDVWVLGGHVNCSNVVMAGKDERSANRAELINNTLEGINVIRINRVLLEGEPTHRYQTHGHTLKNTLDYIFVKADKEKVIKGKINDNLGEFSEHSLVWTELLSLRLEERAPRWIWNVRASNKQIEEFSQTLNRERKSFANLVDAIDDENLLWPRWSDKLIAIAKHTVGGNWASERQRKPYWTAECLQAVKKQRLAFKRVQKLKARLDVDQNELKQAIKHLKQTRRATRYTIRRAKRNAWNKFVSAIKQQGFGSKEHWTRVKSISKKKSHSAQTQMEESLTSFFTKLDTQTPTTNLGNRTVIMDLHQQTNTHDSNKTLKLKQITVQLEKLPNGRRQA